ncbi:MAG TPA: hypothetical protein VK831_04205 [Candidatus Deferrimicrobiaceae bacterium]|nr:hypothetical protein [Candidatus Deferrimicrobiaceae bacterium]
MAPLPSTGGRLEVLEDRSTRERDALDNRAGGVEVIELRRCGCGGIDADDRVDPEAETGERQGRICHRAAEPPTARVPGADVA